MGSGVFKLVRYRRLRTKLGAIMTLLAALGVAPNAVLAGPPIDMAKITCAQYNTAVLGDLALVTAWYSGYYNASRRNTLIDPAQARDNVSKVAMFCSIYPKATVMNAVRQTLKR